MELSILYAEKLRAFNHKSLSNIMPIENIPSVIKNGILCHDKAVAINHSDISLVEVQQRRNNVTIPNGMKLHRYASLYFSARNPMMYKRKNFANGLCVLAVSFDVLNIKGCVVTDRNAATDVVKFYTPEDGLRSIDFEKVFARDWTDNDFSTQVNKKAIKCAEVLIPDCVPYAYIVGAYVANEDVKADLIKSGFDKRIAVFPDLFFMKGGG